MKISIGTGRIQIAGYCCVDIDPDTSPDVCADITHMPFPDGSIDEVYISHLLEHVEDVQAALRECFRVMRYGSHIFVAVPDPIQTYYLWKHGVRWGGHQQTIDRNFVNSCVFGSYHLGDTVPEMAQIWPKYNRDHKQFFIFDMLTQSLIEAGFDEVTEVTACPVRKVDLGETMVGGRKFGGHLSCFTEQPYCLTRRGPIPEGE